MLIHKGAPPPPFHLPKNDSGGVHKAAFSPARAPRRGTRLRHRQCAHRGHRTAGMQASPAEQHATLSATATLAALRITSTQLPLIQDSALLSTAHDLLLLMHHVSAPSWRLALALAMNQQAHLQQVRQRAPKLWVELRAAVAPDEALRAVAGGALGL